MARRIGTGTYGTGTVLVSYLGWPLTPSAERDTVWQSWPSYFSKVLEITDTTPVFPVLPLRPDLNRSTNTMPKTLIEPFRIKS
ncbi:MAG TPA: hypothetical protein PLL01_13655, partial [Rhodoferax sp.]|nr:hypothetical protein [Rhodoferax sp.]